MSYWLVSCDISQVMALQKHQFKGTTKWQANQHYGMQFHNVQFTDMNTKLCWKTSGTHTSHIWRNSSRQKWWTILFPYKNMLLKLRLVCKSKLSFEKNKDVKHYRQHVHSLLRWGAGEWLLYKKLEVSKVSITIKL